MAVDTSNFVPDVEAEISIRDYGIPILFKILNQKGEPYNLTNATKIEVYFQNLDDPSASEVVGICTKVDAINGFCFYNKKQNDIKVKGRTKAYPVVYNPVSVDFPEGQRISGLKLSPGFITVVD